MKRATVVALLVVLAFASGYFIGQRNRPQPQAFSIDYVQVIEKDDELLRRVEAMVQKIDSQR